MAQPNELSPTRWIYKSESPAHSTSPMRYNETEFNNIASTTSFSPFIKSLSASPLTNLNMHSGYDHWGLLDHHTSSTAVKLSINSNSSLQTNLSQNQYQILTSQSTPSSTNFSIDNCYISSSESDYIPSASPSTSTMISSNTLPKNLTIGTLIIFNAILHLVQSAEYWNCSGNSTYLNEVSETSELVSRWPASDSQQYYAFNKIYYAKHYRDQHGDTEGLVLCTLGGS